MKTRVLLVLIVATVGLTAVLGAMRTGWVNDYREATLLLAGVAAVGAVAGAVITWIGSRKTTQHLKELTVQQEQAAADIRRLAELTESSLDEARAQKPEPVVKFVVGDERTSVSEAVVERKRLVRDLGVEKIIAGERKRALAQLPPVSRPPDSDDETPSRPDPFASLRVLTAQLGPIGAEEREEFAKSVDEYANELREWLSDFEAWRQATDLGLRADLRFENRGRVPATGVRVQLHFPDGFSAAEEPPTLGDPPRRPRFQRRSAFSFPGLGRALRPDIYSSLRDIGRVPLPPVRGNVSRPRYRDGSLAVEFEIEKLRHGIPEESPEPVLLVAKLDGEFVIPWEIHAENLGEPARGELTLVISTEVEDGHQITSLAELLRFVGRQEPQEEA